MSIKKTQTKQNGVSKNYQDILCCFTEIFMEITVFKQKCF